MMENYSLSDVALATGGLNGGWGNFGGMGGLLLGFLGGAILSNGGLFGGWGGQRGNVATQDDVAAGFNFAGVNNKLNEIVAGISGVNQNLGNAICQLGYQGAQHTYELGSKIDNCCCQTQLGIQGVKFDMANYASAIQMSQMQGTQKVLDKLCAMELANKDAQIVAQGQRISQLENDLRFCRLPVISNVGWTVNPVPSCNPCGCTTNI